LIGFLEKSLLFGKTSIFGKFGIFFGKSLGKLFGKTMFFWKFGKQSKIIAISKVFLEFIYL